MQTFGQGLERSGMFVTTFRPALMQLLPFLEVLKILPDRSGYDGNRGFYFHSRIPSR